MMNPDNPNAVLGPVTYRTADMGLLDPRVRPDFLMLENDLKLAFQSGELNVWFRPFETFRHPARQREALLQKTSRADMYQSAHALGLAADFVPWDNGRWSWKDGKHWDFLRHYALRRGLVNELTWDRAHVEHPWWQELQHCLKVMAVPSRYPTRK